MITFRIKPKVRYHRHAVTRKRAELMDSWNPIGRKVAREAAIAATEISRRGKVRRQHRHGNDRGQKTQHRMGSFVESASGQHCKSTKITPAAKAAGEADRFCVSARSAASGLNFVQRSPCRRRRTCLWTCALFAAAAVISPLKDGDRHHIRWRDHGGSGGTTTAFGTRDIAGTRDRNFSRPMTPPRRT
jgi:hypothetical protein